MTVAPPTLPLHPIRLEAALRQQPACNPQRSGHVLNEMPAPIFPRLRDPGRKGGSAFWIALELVRIARCPMPHTPTPRRMPHIPTS